jgi:GNAT superfamily N-acetyltransferase
VTTLGIDRSPLDEARFGVATLKATLSGAADVDVLLARLQAEDCRLALVRCPCAELALAQRLEAAGAFLCDSLVYFRHQLRSDEHTESRSTTPAQGSAGPDPAAPPPAGSGDAPACGAGDLAIRSAGPDDAAAVAAVAHIGFAGYLSHYRADPRLPAAAVDAIYPDWAHRLCRADDADTRVLAATVDGRIVGFAAWRRDRAAGVFDIVLNAVLPDWRRRGIYRRLLRAVLATARAEGVAGVLISTQAHNLAVQRAWVSEGFMPQACWYTFHLWRDPPA